MKFSFSKFVGAGNDFVIIDDRDLLFPSDNVPLIQHLCNRHYGIGADGVILLQNSAKLDFTMRIFNADGKEAEMCGNGLRCFKEFLYSLRFEDKHYCIDTLGGVQHVNGFHPNITTKMPYPPTPPKSLSIHLNSDIWNGTFIIMGVPHFVIFVENLNAIDVAHVGRQLRSHNIFQSHGANINFVQIHNEQEVSCRTYERGVEAETLACGTGATAIGLAMLATNQGKSPIKITPSSQETFLFHADIENKELNLTGPALKVFSGLFESAQTFAKAH
jgi:diaminopimelate epimerase